MAGVQALERRSALQRAQIEAQQAAIAAQQAGIAMLEARRTRLERLLVARAGS